jgi:hypothetical protein
MQRRFLRFTLVFVIIVIPFVLIDRIWKSG